MRFSPLARVAVTSWLLGCGRSAETPAATAPTDANAGDGDRAGDAERAGDIGAVDGGVLEAAVDGALEGDVGGALEADVDGQASPSDAGRCSASTMNVQVNGTVAALAGCLADVYLPFNVEAVLDCQSSSSSSAALEVWFLPVPGTQSATVFYGGLSQGDATVVVTHVGPVGDFVDGCIFAPNLQGGQDAQAMSLQGSFHVCRGMDQGIPDTNHLPTATLLDAGVSGCP